MQEGKSQYKFTFSCEEGSFTLIELIMVIVIIGIMAAIAIPRFISLKADAQQAAEEATIAAVQSGINNSTAQDIVTNPDDYD